MHHHHFVLFRSFNLLRPFSNCYKNFKDIYFAFLQRKTFIEVIQNAQPCLMEKIFRKAVGSWQITPDAPNSMKEYYPRLCVYLNKGMKTISIVTWYQSNVVIRNGFVSDKELNFLCNMTANTCSDYTKYRDDCVSRIKEELRRRREVTPIPEHWMFVSINRDGSYGITSTPNVPFIFLKKNGEKIKGRWYPEDTSPSKYQPNNDLNEEDSIVLSPNIKMYKKGFIRMTRRMKQKSKSRKYVWKRIINNNL